MQTDPEEDYTKGWVPFLDCKIYLDSRPLIPRMETEYWVEKAIEEMRARPEAARVLDLFAGSGAIGIAIAKHLPDAQVDFGEIDTAHFPTILKNIHENRIDETRTATIETDVFSDINGSYDVIFANPPYIARSHKERLQDSVLLHEPELALFAEEDGFALIRKTIEGAAQHLLPGGTLYIEHDPEQAESISILGKAYGFEVENRADQFGVLRFSVLKPMA